MPTCTLQGCDFGIWANNVTLAMRVSPLMGDQGVSACKQCRVLPTSRSPEPSGWSQVSFNCRCGVWSSFFSLIHFCLSIQSKQPSFGVSWTDEQWVRASLNPGLTLTWLSLGKNKLETVPAEAETTVAAGPLPRESPAWFEFPGTLRCNGNVTHRGFQDFSHWNKFHSAFLMGLRLKPGLSEAALTGFSWIFVHLDNAAKVKTTE